MPYVKTERRRAGTLDTPGELAYHVQQLVKTYLTAKGESFTTYSQVLGMLEAVKLDLWERRVKRYEEFRCKENGDVW